MPYSSSWLCNKIVDTSSPGGVWQVDNLFSILVSSFDKDFSQIEKLCKKCDFYRSLLMEFNKIRNVSECLHT